MPRTSFEVPLIPKLIKRVDEILNTSGLARKSIIKGDTIEAYGEVGIKKFYIVQEEVLDDKAILMIDALNNQSLDIIMNLVQTGIEDLYVEIKEQEKLENSKVKPVNREKKTDKNCFVCQGSLKELGIKKLAEDLQARIMVCEDCRRMEFYLD